MKTENSEPKIGVSNNISRILLGIVLVGGLIYISSKIVKI